MLTLLGVAENETDVKYFVENTRAVLRSMSRQVLRRLFMIDGCMMQMSSTSSVGKLGSDADIVSVANSAQGLSFVNPAVFDRGYSCATVARRGYKCGDRYEF